MDILDDMGVSKLSAKVFLKVNYSFKGSYYKLIKFHTILIFDVRNPRILVWIILAAGHFENTLETQLQLFKSLESVKIFLIEMNTFICKDVINW